MFFSENGLIYFLPKVCFPAVVVHFFYSFLGDLYPINSSNFKQRKYNLQLQAPKMATHVFPSGNMHARRESRGGGMFCMQIIISGFIKCARSAVGLLRAAQFTRVMGVPIKIGGAKNATKMYPH
jgi:hypothetical protein